MIDLPATWVSLRKFAQFAEIEPGKALFIPWEQLDDYEDAPHTIRVYAWKWSRRLGRRLRTKKGPAGMYVIRG